MDERLRANFDAVISFDVFWDSVDAFEAEVAAWLVSPSVVAWLGLTAAERDAAHCRRRTDAEADTVFMHWMHRARGIADGWAATDDEGSGSDDASED